MVKGMAMKMASRSIDVISKKKNKFARAAPLFLSFFAVVLHNHNAVL